MKQIFYLCFACSVLAHGQKSEEYYSYKKKFPNESLIRLLEEVTCRISLENDHIKITQNIKEEDLYLDQTASFNSKRSLTYSSFFDLQSIEAASLTYNGSKYKENLVKEFNQKNDLDDSFYDDTKKVSFIYPKLQEGGKTTISYSYNIKNPRFLNAFYFGDYHPIIQNKVTIIADKRIELDFKEFHTEGKNIIFEKKKKGKNMIYTWIKNNSDKYEIDPNTPNVRTFLPHIIPMIKSYEVKKEKKMVLNGISSLYDWYYSLVKDINTQEKDKDLEALVASLTVGKDNDLEKVKAIYYWTQQNIKYIAFEYALGGFIPREANDVFKKKYGDCKDNSSILSEMLSIAGLKGSLTWIGTRSIPYTYKEVPTPAVDNHMILSYENKGKTYYLDATGRYIPIEYPSSFIQGKEALVSYGKDSFKVKKVPVMPSEKNWLIDSTYVKILDQKVVGSSSTHMNGYLKGNFFYRLEDLKKEKDVLNFYNRRFSKGSNKFLIDSYKEVNKYDYDKDFIVHYNFSIQNYIQRVGDEIFINPHFNKVASLFKIKKDRKTPIEYEYKKQYTYTNTIEIPEGFTLDYLPTDIRLNNDLISVSLSYQHQGNKIICNSKTVLNFIELSLEEQKEVNKIIKKASKAYKEIIILKKQ